VEHHASVSPRPWRAAALVAAAVATIELFVLILIGVAVGARFLVTETNEAAAVPLAVEDQPAAPATTATAAAKPTAAKESAPAALTRRETSVIVLNGNGIAGAAAAVADRVRRFDYLIAGTADAPRTDFRRSLVMFRPGFEAEARRLAADLKLKRVIPLDGLRVRDLQGAHVALIIGR
jgi:hypothetical protein